MEAFLPTGRRTNNFKHKEEGEGRMKSDSCDRLKIKSTMQKCINPLQVQTHAANILVYTYTDEESDGSVNVNKASELGEKQMVEFEKELSDSFKTVVHQGYPHEISQR